MEAVYLIINHMIIYPLPSMYQTPKCHHVNEQSGQIKDCSSIIHVIQYKKNSEQNNVTFTVNKLSHVGSSHLGG